MPIMETTQKALEMLVGFRQDPMEMTRIQGPMQQIHYIRYQPMPANNDEQTTSPNGQPTTARSDGVEVGIDVNLGEKYPFIGSG